MSSLLIFEWLISFYQTLKDWQKATPQQTDDHSCGWIACRVMEVVAMGKDPTEKALGLGRGKTWTGAHADLLRREIAAKLRDLSDKDCGRKWKREGAKGDSDSESILTSLSDL
jgi:hypothetical protein